MAEVIDAHSGFGQNSPADQPILDTTAYASGPDDAITDTTEAAAITHHVASFGGVPLTYTATAGRDIRHTAHYTALSPKRLAALRVHFYRTVAQYLDLTRRVGLHVSGPQRLCHVDAALNRPTIGAWLVTPLPADTCAPRRRSPRRRNLDQCARAVPADRYRAPDARASRRALRRRLTKGRRRAALAWAVEAR
jgi:hypothetical protein